MAVATTRLLHECKEYNYKECKEKKEYKIRQQLRRPYVIKLFTAVIYEFSYFDRVFVRVSLKSLLGTNTLAYYENS